MREKRIVCYCYCIVMRYVAFINNNNNIYIYNELYYYYNDMTLYANFRH